MQPLLELAMNLVTEADPNAPISQIRNTFTQFIDGTLTYDSLCQYLTSTIGNRTPAEKIQAILKCRNDPVPISPEIALSDNLSRKKTRSWTATEDNRLFMGVHLYGLDNWTGVSQFVGNGRTRSQCSQRWIRVLDPKISKSHWSPEEEQKLLQLVQRHGEKSWMKVATDLGNRSDVQCRYRYQQLVREGTNFPANPSESSNSINSPEKPIIPEITKSDPPAKSPVDIKPPLPRYEPQEPLILPPPQPIPPVETFIPLAKQPPQPILPETNIPLSMAQPQQFMGANLSTKPPEMNQFLTQMAQIRIDEPLRLNSSHDLFKSDNIFDSSFWVNPL